MKIISSDFPLRNPMIIRTKNGNSINFKLIFNDDGIDHTFEIEKFKLYRKNRVSFKKRYKLKIIIVRKKSTETNAFELNINEDSFVKNNHKELFKDFIDDKEGYNQMKITLNFFDENKDKILSERTGKAVTANEDDEDDKFFEVEHID